MAASTSNITSSFSSASLSESAPLPYSTSPPSGLADCPYVLLAEFDIDEGSVIRHQFPGPTGADQHLLAEHMLPDGAHDRPQDWTTFYLNQIPSLTVKPELLPAEYAHTVAPLRSATEDKGKRREGESDLLYVMNFVRTQKDSTVRRGALVKAIAIVTRNPYIQVYQPFLTVALNHYFDRGTVDVLSSLYFAVNSFDSSAMPSLSLNERLILRASERTDMFVEKFAPGRARPVSDDAPRPPSGGAAERSGSGFDGTRSSSVRSIASLASGAVTEESESSGGRTRSRADTLASVAESQAGSVGTRPGSGGGNGRAGARSTTAPKNTHTFETKIGYSTETIPQGLPFRVPLDTLPNEIGEYSLIKLIQMFGTPTSLVPGPLHPHLHTSGAATPAIIVLFNALVTRKRVVILGHGQPAGSVASLVLAACALGSGCGAVLAGFSERAFPYTNLLNLDNLENVDGFIAGVCNPTFVLRPSGWDVLCNMENGKVTVSKEIAPAPVTSRFSGVAGTVGSARGAPSPFPSLSGFEDELLGNKPAAGATAAGGGKADPKAESPDSLFVDEINASIAQHLGEAVIRGKFIEYCQRFVRLASRHEEDAAAPAPANGSASSISFPSRPFAAGQLGSGLFDDGSLPRELAASAGRIEGWRATSSYSEQQDAWRQAQEDDPLREFDYGYQLQRLRLGRRVPAAECEAIFRALAGVVGRGDEEVVAVLAPLTPYQGGLLPLAFGLFHPSEGVRGYALDLFDALSAHPTGAKFLETLNAFHRKAYARLSDERAAQREQQRQSQ